MFESLIETRAGSVYLCGQGNREMLTYFDTFNRTEIPTAMKRPRMLHEARCCETTVTVKLCLWLEASCHLLYVLTG